MSKRTYSDETKAAVMAALLEGQSVRYVAKEYNIPFGTVGAWSKQLKQTGVTNVSNEKRKDIGELLLVYLQETIITLTEQTRFARSVKWLEKQTASEFAVLHGVQMDKAIRLFEALGRADSPED